MKQRKVYMDYLRVLAAFAVVISHVVAEFWYRRDVMSLEWQVMNICESGLHWHVAIFIMISGSIFLSRDIPTQTIYKKYISRMAVAYIVWAPVYAIVDHYVKNKTFDLSLTDVIQRIIDGGYHMWFIPMIIGLYMCIPIFKEIVKNQKITKYFLGLSFLFTFLLPQIVLISKDFVGGYLAEGMKQLDHFLSEKMSVHTVIGYSFYFILGYYINTVEITKKQRKMIYGLGILGFLGTALFAAILSIKTGERSSQYYDNFCIGILFEAVAIHTWFRYRSYSKEKINGFVRFLGENSFGVYLVHVLLMNILLFRLRLPSYFPTSLISVPVISLILLLLSFGITWVIRQIPVLKKWIV